MALRKSSVLTGLVALGFSCWVSALGLGELTLQSALDEPFKAEIELVNIGEADENQLLVGLASPEDFDRAGVTREFHLLNLKFKTDLSDADHPVVKVSSTESIREPYLDFVVQLQWPAGLLLREYTLFLDLPVFDTTKATHSAAPTVASPVQRDASTKPHTGSVEPTSSSSSGAVNSTSGRSSYRVQGGDTLWKIATRAELGDTTVQQRMVAIHAGNPSAFMNGNANLLKKGAVLRMPDPGSVGSLSPGEAQQLVADQSRNWNAHHKQKAVRELIGDVPSASSKEKLGAQEGLLRLSTSTEGAGSNASQLGRTAGSKGSSSAGVVDNELGLAQEELDRSKRENLELKAKLAGLEAQLNTQSKLLELESDELSAVQLGLAADKAAAEASTAGVTETTAVVGEPAGAGKAGPSSEPTSTTKGPLSGLFTFLQSNWMPLLGLIAVLLGVFFLVAKSKNEDQPELVEPFLSEDLASAESEQEMFDEIEAFVDEEPSVATAPSTPEPESQQPESLEVVEEVDPIGEADIYQSLGNFSEAESVIDKAIEAAPNDSKLHLKRLDLFAAQHDVEGFDGYYPTLLALGDTAATATADRLRANIPKPEVVEETAELTLEQQVAEELGIADLELDLSGGTAQEDAPDELLDEDPLSAELESELDSSFVGSEEDELDLSGIELDLQISKSSAEPTSEESDEDLDAAMFGDISLPDELSADLTSETLSDEVELELSGFESDEIDLQGVELDSSEDAGLELSLDSLDFDHDDELELEAGSDEGNTQLELAQAYVEMGDESGAKDILAEVISNGNDAQKQQANELLAKLG